MSYFTIKCLFICCLLSFSLWIIIERGDEMYNYDYHLHTEFSIDSSESMENMIEKAIELGLDEIAVTDHEDYTAPFMPYPHNESYEAYYSRFLQLKEKYSSKILLTLGVEIGLGTDLKETIAEFVKKMPFDFIIGSIHGVDSDDDLYQQTFFSGKSKDEAYLRYYQHLLNCIKTTGNFNVVGHFDYVSRYATCENPQHEYTDYKSIVDEILSELIRRGKGIELNTSGFRYGLGQVHPKIEFLKRYKELGGEILTIGSDAHNKECICQNFDKAYEMLELAGFKYVTVFRQRKPEFVKI